MFISRHYLLPQTLKPMENRTPVPSVLLPLGEISTDKVHFGAKERDPIKRDADPIKHKEIIQDMRREFLKDLNHGFTKSTNICKNFWPKVLAALSDPQIGLGLAYRMAKDKDVVYIGRNDKSELNGDIVNHLNLEGFGTIVSRKHGNLSVDDKGDYIYTDEGSISGTRVALRLPEKNRRTIYSNAAIAFPSDKFLTLLGDPKPGTKTSYSYSGDRSLELDLKSDIEKSNSLFSIMAHSLKDGESLSIYKAIDDNKIKIWKTLRGEQIPGKAANNPILYVLKRIKNHEFMIFNQNAGDTSVVQFLNPIVRQPAEIPVRHGDRLVFPATRQSNGHDFYVEVPRSIDKLDLERLEQKINNDKSGRINTSNTNSTSIQAVYKELDKYQNMEEAGVFSKVIQANRAKKLARKSLDGLKDTVKTIQKKISNEKLSEQSTSGMVSKPIDFKRMKADRAEEKAREGRKLRNAAHDGKSEDVRRLITDDFVDVDAKGSDGQTALIKAANKGHLEIVKVLLASDANVNEAANDKTTALMALACYQKPDSMTNDEFERNNYDLAKLLVMHGADTEAVDEDQQTAKMLAQFFKNKGMIQGIQDGLALREADKQKKKEFTQESNPIINIDEGFSRLGLNDNNFSSELPKYTFSDEIRGQELLKVPFENKKHKRKLSESSNISVNTTTSTHSYSSGNYLLESSSSEGERPPTRRFMNGLRTVLGSLTSRLLRSRSRSRSQERK